MRTRNTSRFLFGSTVTSRSPRKLEMVAIVRASFRLTEGALQALHVEKGSPLPQGMLRGDTFSPGDLEGARELLYASDFAEWKPRADVLLRGNAFAPTGTKVPELAVRLAVGRWSKSLRVVGDRRWTDRGTPGAPTPFTAVPIDWTRAWGGHGDPTNPVGRDLRSLEVPNLEGPDEPIVDRRHMHRAMALAPINPRWPTRQRKMGHYDAAWQRERAPWYAADFDWSFFNAAPEDQQIEGWLQGDEELHLHNLHPTRPLLSTRLPGLRPRVFGKRIEGGTFEFPMVLDTLLVDLFDEKVVLTWRGLAPVERTDREDVPFILVVEEPLGEAKPAATHVAALEQFAADPNDMNAYLGADLAALQSSAGGAVALPKTKDGVEAIDALLGKRFGPLAEPQRGKVREFLRRSLEGPTPPAGAAATNAALLGAAAAGAGAPRSPSVTGGSQPSVRLRETVQQVEASARRAQRDLAQQSRRPRGVSQVANLSKDERIRALDPSIAAAGQRRKDPDPRPGGSCKGGDYRGRAFDGQDLRGVDLSRTLLEGATFRGAQLGGASLEGAIAIDADFTGANLDEARLVACNLSRAKLEGASMRGAHLQQATLEQSDLTRVVASGAILDEAILRAAKLDEAKLEGATLRRSLLDQASMAGVDLSKARLEGCLLNGVVAPKLQLTEATVIDCSWNGGELDGASFARASIAGCSFLKAKLSSADLTGVHAASAVFIDADLTSALLRGADLREARFADALLRHADFTGADLFRADFSRAQMDDASFRQASAYGAFFWDAGGHRTHFDGANLSRSFPERT